MGTCCLLSFLKLFILLCHTLTLYKHHNHKKTRFAGENNCQSFPFSLISAVGMVRLPRWTEITSSQLVVLTLNQVKRLEDNMSHRNMMRERQKSDSDKGKKMIAWTQTAIIKSYIHFTLFLPTRLNTQHVSKWHTSNTVYAACSCQVGTLNSCFLCILQS